MGFVQVENRSCLFDMQINFEMVSNAHVRQLCP